MNANGTASTLDDSVPPIATAQGMDAMVAPQ